jgi:hypothetical protein
MPIPVLAVQIGQLLGAGASIASGIYNFLSDHSDLAGQLREVMSRLGELSDQIATATTDILEAIDGIRRQIDEDVANDNIALANRALYSDLFTFDNFEQALGNSLQAADRLNEEAGVSFAASFMYVVNIRLIVIRAFDPDCYFANQQFIDQFRSYTNHLDRFVRQIIDTINAAHIVTVETERRGMGERRRFRSVARYLRNGEVREVFDSGWDDILHDAEVRRQANAARDRGIAEDRQQSGVPDMEAVAAAWRQAFMGNLRLALISQVLNRPRMAIDSNPNGLMVDGRILPISLDNLDLRTTLMELLCSRQFRNRIQRAWDAFVNHGDDRLAQFAYRRLFSQDATQDEIALLRGMASNYGYTAFIAALLYCNEYEERYGRGLPGVGQPIIDALQFTQ